MSTENTNEQLIRDVIRLVEMNYPREYVDKHAIKDSLSNLQEKHPDDYINVFGYISGFIRNQRRGTNPVDVVYFCDTIADLPPEKFNEIYRVFEPVSIKNKSIVELVDFLETGRDENISIPVELSSAYDFTYKREADATGAKREVKLLFEYWKHLSHETRESYAYLFRTEEESGNFRNWVEKQVPNQKIEKEFESLGLNYKKWDNPKIAYGMKNKRISEVKLTDDELIKRVKELTYDVTKGNLSGYLSVSPKKLWSLVKNDYAGIDDEKQATYRIMSTIKENLTSKAMKETNGKKNKIKPKIKAIDALMLKEDNKSLSNHYMRIL